ncbi:MAG: glycerol-3-phosphate dehydrogenase/oxidase [Armatimonadetes bacterium]|nr:glycerol-3-phosphate dehydrogenase/oxidase [Armatimonadota bacterium]
MKRDLQALTKQVFDLLVIGGGIFGCGIARDAALRGMSVALVEKSDFGGGTTSASSRLIHGGLRYLALGDFALVREALKERQVLLHLAPNRITMLPFLVPLYRSDPFSWRLIAPLGVTLYRWLAHENTWALPNRWSPEKILRHEPLLRFDGLLSGWSYLDAQEPFPERLCLDNLLDAVRHGAQVANYAKVTNLLLSGEQVIGAVVQDLLADETFEIRARCVVNAAGAWVDDLVKLAKPKAPSRVRRTKGIHLLVPAFVNHAFTLRAPQDGRIFFVLPWNGFSLIGTTDTDCDEPLDKLTVSDADVDYLVAATRHYFPDAPLDNFLFTFVGVRSLVRVEGKMPSSVSRRHLIVDHAKEGLKGLISVVGGKMTTYRRIAQEVVDMVCQQLGKFAPCVTHHRAFVDDHEELLRRVRHQAQTIGWDEPTIKRLVTIYGQSSEAIVKRARQNASLQLRLDEKLPKSFVAEVIHAVEAEMAVTVDDLMFRRTMLGFDPQVREAAIRVLANLPIGLKPFTLRDR